MLLASMWSLIQLDVEHNEAGEQQQLAAAYSSSPRARRAELHVFEQEGQERGGRSGADACVEDLELAEEAAQAVVDRPALVVGGILVERMVSMHDHVQVAARREDAFHLLDGRLPRGDLVQPRFLRRGL